MNPNADSFIRFSGVSLSFVPGRPVLENLDARFAEGGFNLIRGPSGGGKTTFLKLINRLEEPSTGRIYFKGTPLNRMDPPALRRRILYLQQLPTVIEGSVAHNLCLPFRFRIRRGAKPPGRDRLKELLADFRLRDVDLEQDARTLSVGQRQRVCFLRAVLLQPEVLLLDEPASGLDEESGLTVEREAERLCGESGLTVFLVSHRPFRPTTVEPAVFHLEGGRLEKREWKAE